MLTVQLDTESVCSISRRLIKQGYSDQPLECYRGAMLCLTVNSIATAAKLSVHEEPTLHYAPYKQFDRSRLLP